MHALASSAILCCADAFQALRYHLTPTITFKKQYKVGHCVDTEPETSFAEFLSRLLNVGAY
jgi:hypothetical protein